MWPNIFAPSFWTLLGIGLAHFHNMKHIKKQNDLLDPTTPGGLGHVMTEIKKVNGARKESGSVD